jgi:hypothetical protein
MPGRLAPAAASSAPGPPAPRVRISVAPSAAVPQLLELHRPPNEYRSAPAAAPLTLLKYR